MKKSPKRTSKDVLLRHKVIITRSEQNLVRSLFEFGLILLNFLGNNKVDAIFQSLLSGNVLVLRTDNLQTFHNKISRSI